MSYDELELDRIGDRKTAVFFTISDTTPTYNFIVALAFSQMFNLLCERADNVHGGRLPHHVRVLWDEAPDHEKNFTTLLEMINASEAREDDETFKNPVDVMFDELEARDPDHFAVKQYRKYKLAAGDICSK